MSGKAGRHLRLAIMVLLAMSWGVNNNCLEDGRKIGGRWLHTPNHARGNNWTKESGDRTTLFDETSELPPRLVFAFLVIRRCRMAKQQLSVGVSKVRLRPTPTFWRAGHENGTIQEKSNDPHTGQRPNQVVSVAR